MPPRCTVAVTGDLQLSRPLAREGADAPEAATAAVYARLRAADLTFANVETPLSHEPAGGDKLVAFAADPGLAPQLRAIGVDVATLANNHALDCGAQGLHDTLTALAGAGIATVGAGASINEAFAPHIAIAHGLRVAFVGLSGTLPPGSAATADRPGIAPIRVYTRYVIDAESLLEQPGTAPYVETGSEVADVARAADAVRRAKAAADLVIVGMHWGVPAGFVAPFQDAVAEYQPPLAHALVEAGASVIVGNHAHVLHPIAFHRGAVIFYSLGNFLFHRLRPTNAVGLRRDYPPYSWKSLRSRANRLSALPVLTLDADGVRAVEIVPLMLTTDGEPAIAEGAVATEILTMLDETSRAFGARIEARGVVGHAVPTAPDKERSR
ncbi:MAG: CapA family protein [Armatimonadetes bacterium]|nr:CapA family protein [Armatimonadota bacterium]